MRVTNFIHNVLKTTIVDKYLALNDKNGVDKWLKRIL